jgi:hypothetical protein
MVHTGAPYRRDDLAARTERGWLLPVLLVVTTALLVALYLFGLRA